MADDALEAICPYCGEPGTVEVEAEEEEADFVQDCAVCCRPWQVRLRRRRDGSFELSVGTDAD